MKKLLLLTKTLLAAALLCVGQNAWGDGIKRVLEHQNYESANVTDWHSNDGTISRTTGDATYGAYTNFAWQSGDGANRSAYKQVAGISGTGFTTKEMSTNGYNVEFDISLKSGNKKNKSESQFIVVSTLPYNITANAAYSGTDYLFSLSMGQFAEDGYKTTWYINDLANTSGTTKTLENTKWYHVKLVVTATSVAYTITDNSTSTVVHSGSKTVASMPTIRGFYSLNAYGGAFMKFDNLEIYDYSSLPAMTKSWEQDYRTVTKSQTEMASASGDATCTNAISTGESFYWIPSLDGSSAATNENVGFYCKNSNTRKWKIANTSSGKCYQGIVNTANSSTVHIYNLKKGQIVKVVGWAANDASPLYAGAGVLTALTGYDNGGIRYYEVNANGTGELTISVSYAYVYAVEVFDIDNEVIGMLDCSTGYTSSIGAANHKDLSISQGEKLKLTFDTHGSGANDYNNWALRIINSSTSFDRTLAGGNHINGSYDDIVQSWKVDGVSKTVEEFRAADFKTQMKNANVDLTITYLPTGMFSVEAVAVGSAHTYTYNMSYNIAFSGDVTMELGVDCAWLEVFSVDKYALATIGSNGFTTFASPYPLDLTSATQTANGFTAYRASSVNSSTVTFKDDVDQKVVANTGVLLHGTANAVVTIPVVASGTELADNALQVNATGNTFPAAANTTYYGMNKGSDPLTFGTFNPASVAIPASKAYLTVATGGGARAIVGVFGDITGVENVEAAPAEAKEGKFIENGKLVIVKNGQKFNAAGAKLY